MVHEENNWHLHNSQFQGFDEARQRVKCCCCICVPSFVVADQDAIPVMPIRSGCKLRKEFQGWELFDGKGSRQKTRITGPLAGR